MIVLADISDREKFLAGYAPAAAALVERFGGRYILRGRGAMPLEGTLAPGQSVIISEWPDREAALRFWHSPEYAAVKKLRAGIAECQVTMVES
jgi:uncharacterized protein (DUF1330 family)